MSKKCTLSWREAHLERTKHTNGGPLVEAEMSKNCTPMWRKAHFQVKMCKTHQLRTLLWREARCQVKMSKAPHARTAFEGSDVVLRGRRKGFCTWPKSEQNVKLLRHFQKRWQAWNICRGSAKMHFALQAQYKRHVHQKLYQFRAVISPEGLHFGASNLQFWEDECV